MNHNGWPYFWIDTEKALLDLVERLKQEEIISIDTETVGWQTGNERLCLIQIGIPSKKEVAIIDALEVPFRLLEPVLSNKTPELIAHNASFEERQFARHKIKLRGVVDTLTMARKLRPDFPNHTLKTCSKLLLGLDIGKEEQTSDWSIRPLRKEQLSYAALDAEIAFKVFQVLFEMERKLVIDSSAHVPELFQDLVNTIRMKIELTKDISAELALLNARENLLRDALRTRLSEGEPSFEGPTGKCSVSKIKKTEIIPDKVRNEFPSVAEMAISEHVDKNRLVDLIEEYGLDKKKLEIVTDIVGFYERLNISFKDVL